MNFISIVGARPQFITSAVICRAAHDLPLTATHRIINTGQHYDAEVSDVFFQYLAIPAPDFHLRMGSGGYGELTGEMIKLLQPVLVERRPDRVVLNGETNSTLAGAVVCSKLAIFEAVRSDVSCGPWTKAYGSRDAGRTILLDLAARRGATVFRS